MIFPNVRNRHELKALHSAYNDLVFILHGYGRRQVKALQRHMLPHSK